MIGFAAIVDVEALAQTALAATAAGLAVTLAFSIAIYGLTRASELQRDGRSGAALAAAALGAVGLGSTLVAVTLGLILMITG